MSAPAPSTAPGRLWRLLAPLLAALLLLTACSGPSNPRGASDGLGSRRADTTQATPGPTPSAATEQQTRPLETRDIYVVYRLILEQYVDQVDHAALVEAATRGVRTLLADSAALPIDLAALDLAPPLTGDRDRDWQAFAEGYSALTKKFPSWSAERHPEWAALDAMLDSLADGHSSFSDPETNRRRQERSYAGIGVRLRRGTAPAPAVIVEVFRDTPASASGLKPGDRLVEVDGQPLAGLTLDQVVNRVRGPKGSEVRLTVDRPNVGQLSFTLTRAEVSVRPVEAALVGPIGYIRIRTFSDDRPIAEFVAEALRNGNARGAQGWILDLRGNGGGLLRHIQQTAGLWLGNKPIGIEIDRQRRRTTLTAEGRPLSVNQPLVVLVDRESSSGAEILAAALREHGVAHLVGTTTAGSVGVAQSLDLPDGSSVQLTVRRFLSSTGAPIDRVGVAPDEFVELTEQDLANGDDPQLERAAQYLQQKLGG